MTTHAVRSAYNALAAANNSLVTAKSEDMDKYDMTWAAAKYVKGEKIEKTMGLWKDKDFKPVRFTIMAIVDLEKSHIGSYGNCYWDPDFQTKPTRKQLSKAKFSLDLTYPVLAPGHVDEDIAAGVGAQLYRFDEIQRNAMDKIRKEGLPEPEKGTTDFARFEESERGVQGWLRVTLGNAFVPAVRRIKASDIADKTPLQSTTSQAEARPDIEEDPMQYFQSLGKHNLRHNEQLPCFKSGGERIGRTSGELRQELYHGRWVKVDVDLVMWNLKSEDKQVYQLIAKRLETIDGPAAVMGGQVYAPAFGNAPPSDDQDTLSEESTDKDDKDKANDKKRGHDGDDSAAKKARTE